MHKLDDKLRGRLRYKLETEKENTTHVHEGLGQSTLAPTTHSLRAKHTRHRSPTMYSGAKIFDGSVQLHGGGGGYSAESSLPSRAVWGKRVLLGLLGVAVLVGATLEALAPAR